MSIIWRKLKINRAASCKNAEIVELIPGYMFRVSEYL